MDEKAGVPERCPACDGKGGWRRDTYEPINPKFQEGNADVLVCFFCRGNKRVILPVFGSPGAR